ncbi:hypothetical protein [Ancylothrix sp. D3o]|nr:hypothetical protein [Ancylothrix sp. D3o]
MNADKMNADNDERLSLGFLKTRFRKETGFLHTAATNQLLTIN